MATMLTEEELKETKPTDLLSPVKYKLEMEASRSALLKCQAHQNPTFNIQAGRFKMLFAALITEAEKMRDRELFPEKFGDNDHVPNINANEKTLEGRSACELAIQHLETACLLMVKAALL
jgi:hypothetical protein